MSADTNSSNKKMPFDFERAMFLPFNSGEGSFSFVVKSGLFYAIGMIIIYLVFGKSMQSASIAYQEQLIQNPDQIGSALLALYQKQIPYIIALWLVIVVMEAALYRRVFRGPDNDLFPWRFGKDELRVMLCQFVTFIIFFIVMVLATIVFALISGLIGSVVGGVFAWLMNLLAIIGTFLVTAAVTIRFAPAAARSVEQNRIALVSVWPVAHKRYWPALGSYVILWLVGIIIFFVLALVLTLTLQGSEMIEIWKNAMSGNAAKNLELSKEMQEQGLNFKGLIVSSVQNMYFAALYLCAAGVGAYLNFLYGAGQEKLEEPNVDGW